MTKQNKSPQSPSPLKAEDIPVQRWREILVWPFSLEPTMEPRQRAGTAEFVDEVAKNIFDTDASWTRVRDPLSHATGPGQLNNQNEISEAFAELVYFHDFIQRSIFAETREPGQRLAGGRSSRSPLYLFQRNDIRRMTVTLLGKAASEGGSEHSFRWKYEFEVVRMNLYVFRTGAAVFVIELLWSAGGDPASVVREGPLNKLGHSTSKKKVLLDLSQVLTLRDRLRRAYAPFFFTENAVDGDRSESPKPGLVAESVTWHTEKGSIGPFKTEDQWADAKRLVQNLNSRDPPVFSHWSKLLPAVLVPRAEAESQESVQELAAWRHIFDERIPNLTWLSLTAKGKSEDYYYRRISRGDWVRLCFADEAGGGDLPYDETFLQDFEKVHCYDRFFGSGTRFLICRNSFSVVGFGKFFDTNIERHFRRIYFDMALLAQFEYASLLAFSSRISRAIARYDDEMDDEQLNWSMTTIQAEFLQFVHRFRLTGVSNQLQGREIFEMLRRHLDLGELFKDLQTEITTATSFLRAQDQQLETEAASRLSVVATVGATMGLAFTLLGMNVLFGSDLVNAIMQSPAALSAKVIARHVGILTATVGIFGIIMFGILKYFRREELRKKSTQARLEYLLLNGGWLLVIVAAVAIEWSFLP